MAEYVQKLFSSVRGILFADPRALYRSEMHLVNQSFYFRGTNGKAVLLVHGWTSTSYEVRRIGKYLNENGYTVYAPMLTGHGTMPKDLEGVRWQQWLSHVEEAYLELTKDHQKVFVGGTSLGANLVVLLSEKYPSIAGIILMAMPGKLKFESMCTFFFDLWKRFRRYNKKFYPITFGSKRTITRVISYQTYPVESADQMYALIKKSRLPESLEKVCQPALLMQSTHDHLVTKDNMEYLFEHIGSKIKEKKYIQRAYHTFISDIKNEHVFEDILDFIEEN